MAPGTSNPLKRWAASHPFRRTGKEDLCRPRWAFVLSCSPFLPGCLFP